MGRETSFMLARMKKHIQWLCGLSLLGFSSFAVADITIQQAVTNMIDYLTAVNQTQTQADADLMFMEAAGTNYLAKSAGTTASSYDINVPSLLAEKMVQDINWALYGVARPGELENGFNVADGYTHFLNKHKANFCAPSSGVELAVFPGICQPQNPISNQYADIKISSVLGADTYNTAQQLYADDTIRTLVSPFPSDAIKPLMNPAEINNPANAQLLASIYAAHALLSVPRNSLNHMYADRLPLGGLGVSKKAMIRNEVQRRFQNDSWYDAIAVSSTEALLRELVHMEAFRLYLDNERESRMERVEALLAALTSSNVNYNLATMVEFSKQN